MIDWFLPGFRAGGPIVSCVNFSHLMKDEYDLYVYTSNTDLGEDKPYDIPANTWLNNIDPGFKVYYADSKKLGWRQLMTVIAAIDPDYLYLNSMYSRHFVLYPIWMAWLGKLRADIVLCPRGALYESALAIKPFKKSLFLKLFRFMNFTKGVLFQATNMREKEAIERFFPKSRVAVVEDLPSTLLPESKGVLKSVGSIKCIFIARIAAIKNLLFSLEVMSMVKCDVDFTIVGPIEDQAYWKLCQDKIRDLPANIRVSYIGSRPAAELIEVLQRHHVYMLPTLGENFGHTIFESLSAGRPVIISDQTPWLSLRESKVGWDIPLQNREEFVAAVTEASSWSQTEFDQRCSLCRDYAKTFLKDSDFKVQYRSLFIATKKKDEQSDRLVRV